MNVAKALCRIHIAGGGLSGLAAAIGIRKSGHDVTVFERMTEPYEIGAGIGVPPNATLIFKAWDMLETLRSVSMVPEVAIMRSYRDGAELSRQVLGDEIEDKYATPYLSLHRADLYRVLLDEAMRLGITIRFNSDIKQIDFATPSLVLSTGERSDCDVIIGADGHRSICRQYLLGRLDPPESSGDEVFRITVKSDEVKQHSDLIDLVEPPKFDLWVGPGAHAMTYSLKRDGLLNIVIVKEHGLNHELQLGPRKVEMQELQKVFSGWDPRFRTLLTMAENCSKWTLLECNELSRWTNAEGNFCLVGDAAHAIPPYLGQGAAMSFEDAGVLSVLFNKIWSKDQIPDILTIFEQTRRRRTGEMLRRTQQNRDAIMMEEGLRQQEQERHLLQDEPFDGFANFLADPVLRMWMFRYNAFQEAEKA